MREVGNCEKGQPRARQNALISRFTNFLSIGKNYAIPAKRRQRLQIYSCRA